MENVKNVNFNDKLLIDILEDEEHEQHTKTVNSLIFLALCHTVKYHPNIGEAYSATSPDELALVNFAKFCGFEY